MGIGYLFTATEFDLVDAMVLKKVWNGSQEDYERGISGLSAKGYVYENDGKYTVERIIYGLFKAMDQTEDKDQRVLENGRLYQNPDLWIYVEQDPHQKSGYIIRPFADEKSFEKFNE